MARTIIGLQPPSPHQTGETVSLILSAESAAGGGDLPSWLTIDNANQELVIGDVDDGVYGEFQLEATALADVPDPDWLPGSSLKLQANTRIPFDAVWDTQGNEVCVRDCRHDANYKEFVQGDIYTDPSYYQISGGGGDPYVEWKKIFDLYGNFNPANTWQTDNLYKAAISPDYPEYNRHPQWIGYPFRPGDPTNPDTPFQGDPANAAPYLPWWKGEWLRPWNFPRETGFQIEEIGTRNLVDDIYHGITFVNSCPSSYGYMAHCLDQNRWLGKKKDEVYTASVVWSSLGGTTLPEGVSFSEPWEWGEFIYDGTPTTDQVVWLIVRFESESKIQERAVRMQIITPAHLYGDQDKGATYGEWNNISMREYFFDMTALYGKQNPTVLAFTPGFVPDMDVQSALADAYDGKNSNAQMWPDATDEHIGCREWHFVCMNADDRSQRVDMSWKNKISSMPMTSTGEPLKRDRERTFRFCMSGWKVQTFEAFKNHYKHITLTDVVVHPNEIGPTAVRIGTGTGPRDQIIWVTMRNVDAGWCGGNLHHPYYIHAGPLGRCNFDSSTGHDANGGQSLKMYPGGEAYVRNSSFPLMNKMLDWQFGDTRDWYESQKGKAATRPWPIMPSAQTFNVGSGLRRVVVNNNDFYGYKIRIRKINNVTGEVIDNTGGLGKDQFIGQQARAEWCSTEHPVYGTTEFMYGEFWDDSLSYSGVENPDPDVDYVAAISNIENPYTLKKMYSGNRLWRFVPPSETHGDFTYEVTDLSINAKIGDGGSYPINQSPPSVTTGSGRAMFLVPEKWHERSVTFYATDNVESYMPGSGSGPAFEVDFKPNLQVGDNPSLSAYSTYDRTRYPVVIRATMCRHQFTWTTSVLMLRTSLNESENWRTDPLAAVLD